MPFTFLPDRRSGVERRNRPDRRREQDRRKRPSIEVVARPSQDRGVYADLRFEIKRRSGADRRVIPDRRDEPPARSSRPSTSPPTP